MPQHQHVPHMGLASWTCRLERGWSSFNYLIGSETFSLAEVDDGEAFRDTLDAMAIVGLNEQVRATTPQMSYIKQ